MSEAFGFELFTTSYKKYRPEFGVPVRTSNGRPKWALPYSLDFMAKPMFPKWTLVKAPISDAEFRVRYHRDLDQIGVARLAATFQQIAYASGQTRLVLMCFEDQPEQCHRGDFAKWWQDHTGMIVPELPEGVVQ